MTPEQASKEAKGGKIRPVYLLVGEERHLMDKLVRSLREATMKGGVPGLNEDTLTAPQASIDEVLATARTLPMLASKRWILIRSAEKWEDAGGKGKGKSALDPLVEYLGSPSESTVLVLTASKLDKRKRLFTTAKKLGALVSCEALKRNELPVWVAEQVEARENSISRSVADLIAELAGPDLSAVADAVERVCLYAGEGARISEEAVAECVVRLRTQSVWELVGAVGRQDTSQALRALDDVYDPSDRGLRLLGVLAWATRQLMRFDAARRSGLDASAAAKAAGAPPFKARELEQQLRGLKGDTLQTWLQSLAQADLDLKGGSKRPPRSTLEHMIIGLCAFS